MPLNRNLFCPPPPPYPNAAWGCIDKGWQKVKHVAGSPSGCTWIVVFFEDRSWRTRCKQMALLYVPSSLAAQFYSAAKGANLRSPHKAFEEDLDLPPPSQKKTVYRHPLMSPSAPWATRIHTEPEAP
jgi:hypothetical protein|mmetsp:Transcript_53381/g.87762  ORF Transcript_53381/g.87762 Transcript_53381/m.87762 type:complete len:127 (+) Transcript_53381:1245-1625(+)